MAGSARLRSLYVCYLSLDDPLVHTQVIAYLRGLAEAGHEIHLLTFEVQPLTRERRRRWREQLAREGIHWHGLRYHKTPSLPATVYDTLIGAAVSAWLLRRHRLDTFHARSHVPAAMGLIARRLSWPRPRRLIFDIRGLMAEEYVDAGRWVEGGAPWRLTKTVERAAIRRADGIVVLTERVRRQLFPDGDARVTVIPCCADFSRLQVGETERRETRGSLRFDDRLVMTYVGKFGGWYMAAEMADFFSVAARVIPNLHFQILTQGHRAEIENELRERGLVPDQYTIDSVAPEELGPRLAASDFGISFIRPSRSKDSSSPTKVGEYLAAGLPVLSTARVGDLDTLIGSDVGVLVDHHDAAAYRAAAEQMTALIAEPETEARCRQLAERELSLSEVGVPGYDALYTRVAARR